MRTFFTAVFVLVTLLSMLKPASAQTVPASGVTQEQVAAVRTHLASAVDAAMPAVHCPTTSPSMIISVNDATRVIGCGMTDWFEVMLVQNLGLVMAQLNATATPRHETLETAQLYTAYLEALTASRHAPVELTFAPVTVVASR